jgi:hypothetical protein
VWYGIQQKKARQLYRESFDPIFLITQMARRLFLTRIALQGGIQNS